MIPALPARVEPENVIRKATDIECESEQVDFETDEKALVERSPSQGPDLEEVDFKATQATSEVVLDPELSVGPIPLGSESNSQTSGENTSSKDESLGSDENETPEESGLLEQEEDEIKVDPRDMVNLIYEIFTMYLKIFYPSRLI